MFTTRIMIYSNQKRNVELTTRKVNTKIITRQQRHRALHKSFYNINFYRI